METISKLDPAKLRFARELRCETLVDLADKLGVSRQAVSNWENGKRIPEFQTIQKISDVLNIPYKFLISKVQVDFSSNMTLFRSKVAVPKKTLISFAKILELYSLFVQETAELVSLPEFKISNLIYKNTNFSVLNERIIENVAKKVREIFNLGNGPISNVTALLERAGIMIAYVCEPRNGVYALTKKINGRYFILLNVYEQSAVRIRFSLAHELGHILLHSNYNSKIYKDTKSHSRLEKEADLFASMLLMPQDGFLLDVIRPTLGGLTLLKPHWKVSIQSMVMRLYQLGIIDESHKIMIFKEISRKYSRFDEPYDSGKNKIRIDYPSLINAAFEFLNNQNVNYKDYFSKKGIPLDFIQKEFNYLKLSSLQNNKIPHLRIVK